MKSNTEHNNMSIQSITYINPWARVNEPKEYKRCNVPIIEYANCTIVQISDDQWDVVKSGKCIAQRAGKSSAMQVADIVSDIMCPDYSIVQERMLCMYDHY